MDALAARELHQVHNQECIHLNCPHEQQFLQIGLERFRTNHKERPSLRLHSFYRWSFPRFWCTLRCRSCLGKRLRFLDKWVRIDGNHLPYSHDGCCRNNVCLHHDAFLVNLLVRLRCNSAVFLDGRRVRLLRKQQTYLHVGVRKHPQKQRKDLLQQLHLLVTR